MKWSAELELCSRLVVSY